VYVVSPCWAPRNLLNYTKDEYDRWMEIKTAFRLEANSEVANIIFVSIYIPLFSSKNYRRQNKMTFSPELYIVALKKWMVYVLNIFNLYIYQKFLESYWPQIWTHSVEIVRMLRYSVDEENVGGKEIEARSDA
jgi:hypothetical protein